MSLDMFSNVLDLPVVSIFSPLMERSFPTLLPFLASFLLGILMRSVRLRANRHLSRDDTEMNSIFLEKGRDWQRSTAEKPSGSTHSPIPEGPQLRTQPTHELPKPGTSICKQNLACGMFQLACSVLVYTVLSV